MGEAQVLEPVLDRLPSTADPVQAVLSFSSPSVTGWPVTDVRHADFAPFDEPRAVQAVLRALDPALLVIARDDLWPELVTGAGERGIPVAVIGARMSPRSARRRRLLSSLYAPVWRTVSWWGACTAEDGARLEQLGVPPDRITVTGDPRHDRILDAAAATRPAAALETWVGGDPVLVAGSTHPSDTAPVLQAFAAWRRDRGDARLIVVPHDPSPDATAALARQCRSRGLTSVVWSDDPRQSIDASAPVCIVAVRGALQGLYHLASLAYVGGGFGRRGVHAVMEPAACGVPVAVGPKASGDPDVQTLVAAGACRVLSAAAPARELADALARGAVERDAREVFAIGSAGRTARALATVLHGGFTAAS